MEMIAALAVNVPGFPVPRVKVGVQDGRQLALVAAGVVTHTEPEYDYTRIAEAVAAAIEAREHRRTRIKELALRVHGEGGQ